MTGRAPLPLLTVTLLLVAASRLLRLDDLTMNPDEVWSIWQTFGSVEDILRWTPYDWPPLYYLILGFWSQIAGIQPLALRSLSALAFLPGAALAYRLLLRWRDWRAGLLAMLVWSGLGLAVRLSLEVRGYALLLPLTMLSLWLTLRYLDRPGWRRAPALSVVLAGMFWISYTAGMVILLVALAGLVIYRRRAWRLWQPGLLGGILILPELLDISGLLVSRVGATQTIVLPPFIQAVPQLYVDYFGSAWPVTGALAAIALWLLWRRKDQRVAPALALAIWAPGMSLLMYALNPVLGLFHGRYSWWILPGIALLIALGLARLPRRGMPAVGVLLALTMFAPLPDGSPYQIFDRLSPLEDNFRWLREHMQWGDVLLTNVRNSCGAAEEWDYHQRAWLPNGLQFIDTPASQQRRIWVLNPDRQGEDIRAQLDMERIPGPFVGPYGCLLRLYEAAPDPEGMAYANGLRFHGAELMRGSRPVGGPPVLHEGETLTIRLWWTVDESPARDYSLHTWLERNGAVLDEINGPPAPWWPPQAPDATSRWQPGSPYVEVRELTLPRHVGAGDFNVYMKLYFWEDLEPVAAAGLGPHGERRVLAVRVRSYRVGRGSDPQDRSPPE